MKIKVLSSYFALIVLLLTFFKVNAQVPSFTSTPLTTAAENVAYSYGILAEDRCNDQLTFAAATLPAWLAFSADGQNAANKFGSEIPSPMGVAGDPNGNVYVSDTDSRIYKITPDGTTTVWASRSSNRGTTYGMTVAGDYLYVGYYNGTTGSITRIALNNPGAGETEIYSSNGQVNDLRGAVLSIVERDGYLYAALYYPSKVIKIDLSDSQFAVSPVVTTGLNGPFGLGFSQNGDLYIANWTARRIDKWNGTSLSPVLQSADLGSLAPSDIKIDKNGNVYVSLYGGGIRKYKPDFSSFELIKANTSSWGMTLTPTQALIFGDADNFIYKVQTGATIFGTPGHADVGVHPVVLTVSDGDNTVQQSFNITVTDPNKPTVTTYSPANNSTSIAADANLVLTFNETIKKGTGNITIKNFTGNAIIEQIDVTSDRVSITGSTLTIDPAADLPHMTTAYVEIAATAILDASDNTYAGISDGTTWKFQTKKAIGQLTFVTTATATYGDADFDPGASSNNSAVAITYTSSDPAVASIADGKVHILKPGTTTITASQAGDSNFDAPTAKTQTLTISPKTLALSLNASPVISKTYDGSTAATLALANYTLSGVKAGDEVTISGTASFDNKNAGESKTVSVVNLTLAGAQKDNYLLAASTASTTGTINVKPLTVTINASPLITKTYDGSSTATLVSANYSLSGIESGDEVSVSGTASFDNKNVGEGKTVNVINLALAGAQKDNYLLAASPASTTGTITAKPLTVTLNASPLITKTYDGTRTATLVSANYSLSGIESGDEVSVSGTATYNTKDAGEGKAVTATDITLSGAHKSNYTLLNNTAATSGNIVHKLLTVTADNKSRLQGTANPTFTITYSGFINGENETALSTAPTATTTALSSSPAGNYSISVSGGVAVNYSFSYITGTLQINPAAPDGINLAPAVVYENQPAGTKAGVFSSVSGDPNATFTYSLVNGTGSTDNALFVISGSELRTRAALDYEQKAAYSILVRSTTQQGFYIEKAFTVRVQDVNEAPTLSAIANQVICFTTVSQSISLSGISAGPESGQTTTLSVSSNSMMFDELNISGSTVNYRVKEGESGSAVVTVTIRDNGGTANGGSDSYTQRFTITVNPLPVATILSPASTQISKGDVLVLTAAGGSTYEWDDAAGIVSGQNSANLTVRPEQTTTYKVAVRSAEGCVSYQEITIAVSDDYVMVKGTNILSPNGDGINDNFIIKNLDMYPNNEVKIYDRAGRLLYSKVNYTDEWTGTFQGSPLSDGAYYYIVDFGQGKPKLKGFITIVRD